MCGRSPDLHLGNLTLPHIEHVMNATSCHAGCQEVSRCHTRTVSSANCCVQVMKHANNVSTLNLKLRGVVTRSPKQGYQWPRKKDSCPPNNFKKLQKKNWNCLPYLHSQPTCQTHKCSKEITCTFLFCKRGKQKMSPRISLLKIRLTRKQ